MDLTTTKYHTYIDGQFTEIYPVDDICRMIKARVQHAEDSAKRAQEELAEMKKETWKDEQLKSMQNSLNQAREDYYRGFPISESEKEAIYKWQNQHYNNRHNAHDIKSRIAMGGAIGGTFLYEFVPTSIGTTGACYCGSCRKKAQLQAPDETTYRNLLKEYDAYFVFQDLD